MWITTWLASFFATIAAWFLNIYRETWGWIWPFNYLSIPFYYVGSYCDLISTSFLDLGTWLVDLFNRAWSTVTAWEVWDMMSVVTGYAYNSWNWILNAWSNVYYIVNVWWSTVSSTVQGWIAVAVQGLAGLLVAWDSFQAETWPQWTALIALIGSRLDYFFTVTLPGLLSLETLAAWWAGQLLAITDLIDSSFNIRADFWQGWQDMRENVVSFFQDPVEAIWTLFADWFLGPEE